MRLDKILTVILCVALFIGVCGAQSAMALSTSVAISSKNLAVGVAATAFKPITAFGGATPYIYSISGTALPSGLASTHQAVKSLERLLQPALPPPIPYW